MKTILLTAAAAIATALPTAAVAQPASSVTVAYGDLDLGSNSGVATLEARISGAVRRVCEQPRAPGIAEWSDYRNCLRDARAAARAHARVAITRANGDQFLAAR